MANLSEFQHCFIFSYLSGASKEGQKGRGAFKCKGEGYALFKASHVQDVKYNFSSHSEFCFFETKVKASMTRNKTYRTNTTPKEAPVRFSDILMIHHDYDADKNNKTDKRIQRKREKLAYTACPSYALKVTSDQIYSFCCDLKANSDKSKQMLVDVLVGNDYEPVIVEDLENKFTKCLVAMDHDYLKGSKKLASKFRQVHQLKWNTLHLVRSKNLT